MEIKINYKISEKQFNNNLNILSILYNNTEANKKSYLNLLYSLHKLENENQIVFTCYINKIRIGTIFNFTGNYINLMTIEHNLDIDIRIYSKDKLIKILPIWNHYKNHLETNNLNNDIVYDITNLNFNDVQFMFEFLDESMSNIKFTNTVVAPYLLENKNEDNIVQPPIGFFNGKYHQLIGRASDSKLYDVYENKKFVSEYTLEFNDNFDYTKTYLYLYHILIDSEYQRINKILIQHGLMTKDLDEKLSNNNPNLLTYFVNNIRKYNKVFRYSNDEILIIEKHGLLGLLSIHPEALKIKLLN